MDAGAEDAADPTTTAWVIEQLQLSGFSPGDAVRLAEAGVDYQKVAATLERGCTHDLAIAIYL